MREALLEYLPYFGYICEFILYTKIYNKTIMIMIEACEMRTKNCYYYYYYYYYYYDNDNNSKSVQS